MEYRLSIEVRTALAVGAGPQPKGGVCPLARDVDGVPCIPGSTLKGVLRTNLERMLKGATVEAASHVCSNGGRRACDATGCPVCTLFGTVGRAGVVRVGDARVSDEFLRGELGTLRRGAPAGEIRTGQPLGRVERASNHHLHAARETAGLELSGLKLVARVEATRPLKTDEENHLKAAARAVLTLGGGGSAGTGHVRVELEGPMAPRQSAESRWTHDMKIVLTAREPFVTSRSAAPPGKPGRPLDHVPGSTLRGALAHALALGLEGGFDHPALKAALSHAKLRVTDAIPSGRRVAPDTLVTCEMYPGFHLQNGPYVPLGLWSHGAWDMLLLEFLGRRLGGSRRLPWTGRCLLAVDVVPCPGRLVSLNRPYLTERTTEEQVAPFYAVFGHTAVDRVAGRGGLGLRHARAVTLPMRGLSRYEARVDGLEPDLARALAGLSQLRIGGSIGTGHGLFGLRLEPREPTLVRASLEAIEEATAKLLALWPGGAATRTEAGLERQRLAILDLSADWIPHQWCATPEETIAADLAAIPGIDVLEARVTVGSTGGFSTTAGLPRTHRRVFRRGGVVLIAYQLIHESAMVEALEKLCRDGAGLLTEEGFGQVCVSDPVHWERVPPLAEGR